MGRGILFLFSPSPPYLSIFLSFKRCSEQREKVETQTLYHEVLDHTMENSAFVTITKLKGIRKRMISLTEINNPKDCCSREGLLKDFLLREGASTVTM